MTIPKKVIRARKSRFVTSQPGRIRVHSVSEVLTMRPPAWLIKDIIPEGGFACLYGPSKTKKSFVAIDMAMSVATGGFWQGQPCGEGVDVLYISAEGGAGIGKRVDAWLRERHVEPRHARAFWILESMPITEDSDAMGILFKRIEEEVERIPSLIIIDTLARCFEGDENGGLDMGRFVAGVDKLRRDWAPCAVLAVHHTRLDGDRERGHTSLKGALDTMIAVDLADAGKPPTASPRVRTSVQGKNGVKLICTKQKDFEEFDEILLRVVPSPHPGGDPDLGSCTLERVSEAEKPKTADGLLAFLPTTGLSSDDWLFTARVPRATFFRHLKQLKIAKQIVKKGGLWVPLDEFTEDV